MNPAVTLTFFRLGKVAGADVLGYLLAQFAGAVLGIGMVVPFVLTLAEFEYFWIANAMYLVYVLQAIVGAIIKLVAYRRGF